MVWTLFTDGQTNVQQSLSVSSVSYFLQNAWVVLQEACVTQREGQQSLGQWANTFGTFDCKEREKVNHILWPVVCFLFLLWSAWLQLLSLLQSNVIIVIMWQMNINTSSALASQAQFYKNRFMEMKTDSVVKVCGNISLNAVLTYTFHFLSLTFWEIQDYISPGSFELLLFKWMPCKEQPQCLVSSLLDWSLVDCLSLHGRL